MNNRSPFGHQWWSLCFALSGCAALVDPIRRQAGSLEMALTIGGVAIFIGAFTSVLLDWRRGRSGLWQTITVALIGAAFAPFNPAAWVFFVVAIAFAAWVAAGDLRGVALIVGGIAALALVEKTVLSLPWSFVATVAGYGVPTAVMTTLTLRRAIAVRELARHAERERIARDMHDVLGHTLSVIILKTDLAARLAHQDPDRVVEELSDVDRIARETLDEVRQTLRGYRSHDLEHELELARNTLMIAGVAVTTEFEPPRLEPAQENVLCLALREGVTNVVRHARAKHCRLAVTARHGDCLLEIEDDGQRAPLTDATEGHQAPEPLPIEPQGAGLAGMRERVAASGGSVTQRVDRGTRLSVRLPLISTKA
jgi:two-component system, NarL family, sensor histidine kinase DesK